MIYSRTRKYITFTLAFVAAISISLYCLHKEKSVCMGVPIISERAAARFESYVQQDFNDRILHMDAPVAIDNASSTIYISQNIDSTTLYTELDGVLKTLENQPLCFVEDDAFNNFAQAVKDGHRFRLIVDTGDRTYMDYYVVFTNLPVIRITGDLSYVNEEERNVYAGDFIIWDSCYEGTGKYSVKTSLLEWNRRGNSTMWDDKKSWKLAFKNEDGTNNDMEFLGLDQSDDDWILNAIHRDDTKVREKMVMEMWNSMLDSTPYNYPMTTGEYVEVVSNGKYVGLYLLQRRLDGKYLELEDEVLLKSIKGKEGDPIENFFEIKYSTYEGDKLWQTLDSLYTLESAQYIDLKSWIDVSLYVDLGYMADNSGRKNVYFIAENIDADPVVRLLLWDTDFSFGVSYSDGFVHKPEGATEKRRFRHEEHAMRAEYPDLDKMLAERWFQLRESVITEENMFAIIQQNIDKINLCGAHNRELELWGNYYKGGTDTVETLCNYITLRLDFLDSEYAKILAQ